MLYYDSTNDSAGIDVNQASESKDCFIWHY